MNIPKIENMQSSNGNDVPNQFIITKRINSGLMEIFQSYNSIIAIKKPSGDVTLDVNKWDCSKTTSKYRNQFLRENKKETQKKIDSGTYKLVDLNK
ncbi:MAG: hypothetical protein WC810_14390 [Janthinobacterium sp.]|jgi:hypothetical protein